MRGDDVVRIIVAVGCVVLACLLFYGLLFHAIPKDNKEMLSLAFAFIGGSILSPMFARMFPPSDDRKV